MRFKFFWWNTAGFVTIYTDTWAFHIFPSPPYWIWGHKAEEYEHVLDYWGCRSSLFVRSVMSLLC